MKKAISLLLCVLLLLGSLYLYASAAEDTVVLLGNGTDAEILIPLDASAQERYAAGLLSGYLQQITGESVPVTSSPGAAGKIRLETNPELAEEAYVIAEKNGAVCISGGGKRGAVYGAYAFLEKLCGCRRYTNDAFLIPLA
jgi:hypothetical protein